MFKVFCYCEFLNVFVLCFYSFFFKVKKDELFNKKTINNKFYEFFMCISINITSQFFFRFQIKKKFYVIFFFFLSQRVLLDVGSLSSWIVGRALNKRKAGNKLVYCLVRPRLLTQWITTVCCLYFSQFVQQLCYWHHPQWQIILMCRQVSFNLT